MERLPCALRLGTCRCPDQPKGRHTAPRGAVRKAGRGAVWVRGVRGGRVVDGVVDVLGMPVT